MTNIGVYLRSDGGYCTEEELWEYLEAGEWTPFCWNPDAGEEWLETHTGKLLRLVPTSEKVVDEV